jgi:putative N6-adenine-specific DNA methylase
VFVKASVQPNQFAAFAVTAPGLEPLCAAELEALGIHGAVEQGGVAWTGDLTSVARANLWLRTASRVIIRVDEFRARTFFELERHAKRIPWNRYVARGAAVDFRVTCRKSKLYHSGAVAQRFIDAVARAVGDVDATQAAPTADDDDDPVRARQLFVVRFFHDVCTVSVDTSGALLHLRGYRQALAKAPLRETLAAAVLLGAGWNGTTPLADPMCGSGTIPIEAALIARRMAPGRHRDFAFLRWPEAKAAMWKRLLADADVAALASSPVPIFGADRDAGAITAALANAGRAGVATDITFAHQPLSALAAADGCGLIATNPPYGVRIGEADRLRNLYAQLGNVVRKQRPSWDVALLSADPALERQTGLALREILHTRNGGIAIRLLKHTAD